VGFSGFDFSDVLNNLGIDPSEFTAEVEAVNDENFAADDLANTSGLDEFVFDDLDDVSFAELASDADNIALGNDAVLSAEIVDASLNDTNGTSEPVERFVSDVLTDVNALSLTAGTSIILEERSAAIAQANQASQLSPEQMILQMASNDNLAEQTAPEGQNVTRDVLSTLLGPITRSEAALLVEVLTQSLDVDPTALQDQQLIQRRIDPNLIEFISALVSNEPVQDSDFDIDGAAVLEAFLDGNTDLSINDAIVTDTLNIDPLSVENPNTDIVIALDDLNPNEIPIEVVRAFVNFDPITLNFQAEGSLSEAILSILMLTDISALNLPSSAVLFNPDIAPAAEGSETDAATAAQTDEASVEVDFDIPSSGTIIDGVLTFDPAIFAGNAELTDNVAAFLGLLSVLDEAQIIALTEAISTDDPALRAAIDALTDAELAFLADQQIDLALIEALEEEELRRTFENYLQEGANFAAEFGLVNGDRPTTEQLANLTSPIILSVRNADGELVTELFRPENDGLDIVRGAPGAIIGDNVYLTADNLLVNRGGIVANTQLAITAGRFENIGLGVNEERGRFRNFAGTVQGGIVSIETTESDIVNIGGAIQGTEYVSLVSAGDVINEAVDVFFTLTEAEGCRGDSCGTRVRDFALAEISSGGELYINAENDIINSASYIGAAGTVRLIAGNDITNEALTTEFVLRDYEKKGFLKKEVDYAEGAIIASGIVQSVAGDVILDAGNDVNVIGSRVEALSDGGLTYARAGNDIVLESIQIELDARTKKKGLFTGGALFSSRSTRSNSFETALAEVTGFDIELHAGQDIIATGAQVNAINNLTLDAGRDIISNALVQERFYEEKTFTLSVSYPGSNLVEAAISGDLDSVGRAFLNANPFTQSVLALAESDTPFELAANGLNSFSRGAAIGGDFRDALGEDYTELTREEFREARNGEISSQLSDFANPFSSFDTGLSQRDANGNVTEQGSGLGGFASNFTFSLSSQRTRNEWTETISSGFSAGNDFTAIAGRDISLQGGTNVDVGGDATINAARDFILAAAENTSSTRSSGWGATFGLRPEGVLGSNINATNADILVGRDLNVETLQDRSESDNFSAGLTVTVGPSGPTGGSANFAMGSSESQRSNNIAGITTTEALTINVAETTTVTGGIIGSEAGTLDLTTTNLVLNDLVERERSTSFSRNISGSDSNDMGGSEFDVSGFGGSFATAALDGTTQATIGQGTVIVTSQTEAETDAQLGGANRDLDNATTITRDSSFDTGDVFIDVDALSELPENLTATREFLAVNNNYNVSGRLADAEQQLAAQGEGFDPVAAQNAAFEINNLVYAQTQSHPDLSPTEQQVNAQITFQARDLVEQGEFETVEAAENAIRSDIEVLAIIEESAEITISFDGYDHDAPLLRTGTVIIEDIIYDDPVEDIETFTEELVQSYMDANPELTVEAQEELTANIVEATQTKLDDNPEATAGDLIQAVETQVEEAVFATNPVTKANDWANAGVQKLAAVAEESPLKAKLISGAVQAGSLALGGPIKGIGTRAIKEAAETQISGAVEDYVGVGIATIATRSDDRAEFNEQTALEGTRHEAQATGATVIGGVLLGASPLALIKKKDTPEVVVPRGSSFDNNLEANRARNTTTLDERPSVVFDQQRHPESVRHIDDAVDAGHPSTLTMDRANAPSNRRAATNGIETRPGFDRDEFPFAATSQGGADSSVRHIPSSDNRSSGGCFGQQCSSIPDFTDFDVKVKRSNGEITPPGNIHNLINQAPVEPIKIGD